MAKSRTSSRRRQLTRFYIVIVTLTSGFTPFFPSARGASFKRTHFGNDENEVLKASDRQQNAERFYYDTVGGAPSEAAAERPGEATRSSSCDVIRSIADDNEQESSAIFASGIPDGFYEKYTEAYGIPVVAPSVVSDVALSRACYVLRFLLADRAVLRQAYYKSYGRVAVIGQNQTLSDVPEYQLLNIDWSRFPSDTPHRSQPRGAAAVPTAPVTTASEENFLCIDAVAAGLSPDWVSFDDMLLKNLAIGILNLADARGMRVPPPYHRRRNVAAADDDVINAVRQTMVAGDDASARGLKAELDAIYSRAMRSGWWKNTNAARSPESYFGEGVQSYFNANTYARTANGYHNEVSDRVALRTYDTWLFAFIQLMFPCANNYLFRCNSRRNEAFQRLRMNCPNSGWHYSWQDEWNIDIDPESDW